MSGWDLFKSERYSEAAAEFSAELRISPSTLAFNNCGMANLHLGNYEAALSDFRSADQLSSIELSTVPDGAMSGVALWMAGDKHAALATWLAGVNAAGAGKVRYGDAAGGVTIGNLLVFASAQLNNNDTKQVATRYLRKRLRTKQATAWPGPISNYLVGKLSEPELLKLVSDVPTLREREMCQAHFYIGVEALSCGRRNAYTFEIDQAVAFGRATKLGAEYYLALHENGIR